MSSERRRKDWMLHVIGVVTLSIILFIGGWIGRNATFIIDNFPLMAHQVQDLDCLSKELKKSSDENRELLQELKRNQETIKLRQGKVIQSLHLLMRMHRMPDQLPFNNYKSAGNTP